MQKDSEFRFMVTPKLSLRPDSMTFYTDIKKVSTFTATTTSKPKEKVDISLLEWGIGTTAVTDSNKHNLVLSEKASKRIREKVTWLYTLAKAKNVKTEKGKEIFGLKMAFITLTLPSEQKHTSQEIISGCLNQFLTELKEKYKVQNYVWRMEYQKNGNCHFHIATDSFVEYYKLRSIWNRCLGKLGYISDYTNKMSEMTFEEYRKKYSFGETVPFNLLRERYWSGVASKWQTPNTVDVKAVGNAKAIAHYISKYITKKQENQETNIAYERDKECLNMRLWFCSRSLSKLDKIVYFLEKVNEPLDYVYDNLTNFKTYLFDYCKIIYYNVSDQLERVKREFRDIFKNYSTELGYVPA